MPLIRKCPHSQTGWNAGDLDVAFQLFRCGMVWDVNLASKSSRDHLVAGGYAVRCAGLQAMTGRGTVAFLTSRAVWRRAWRNWRGWRGNPFVAAAGEVQRAIT